MPQRREEPQSSASAQKKRPPAQLQEASGVAERVHV